MGDTRKRILGFQLCIADLVMRGDLDLAREYALDLAELRDSLPTWPESEAATRAHIEHLRTSRA